MDAKEVQVGITLIIGMAGGVFVYRLARSGLLSFAYSIGWLILSALGIFAWIFLQLIAPLANFVHITPAALLAMGGVFLLILISIQLSVSISGLHTRQRRLVEELAYLQTQIEFERKSRK